MPVHSQTTRTRWGAASMATAPVLMAFTLTAHPYIARLPNAGAVGDAVAARTTWWGVVHLLTAVGAGLMALAFLALRAHLRAVGEDRYSAWALPWVLTGSVLYAFLPGLEFAPLAASDSGGDPTAAHQALEPWFVPVLLISALVFAIGIIGFARAVATADRLLSRTLTKVVVTALVLLALSRLVPLGAVQFYVQAVVGLIALWPLALHMWRSPAPQTAPDRRPTVASARR